MSEVTFDVAAFRLAYPAFPDGPEYTDQMLEGYFAMATCYVSPKQYGWMKGACRVQALNLMTAHLAALAALIASGSPPVFVSSSTVDKVTVTLALPPMKDQFHYWLNLTPYGAQLLALLNVKSAGGWYVGGMPELSAFRGPYGFRR